jgi:hypothetical protein
LISHWMMESFEFAHYLYSLNISLIVAVKSTQIWS